jgi:transposase
MGQIHKRLGAEQVKFLLNAYLQGTVTRTEIEKMLGVGRSRFFSLLKRYRSDPQGFSIAYRRKTPPKLSPAAEAEIERQLLREKKLVDDPRLPISGYNYSALRDRLHKKGLSVSIPTIIRRAKALDCYIPHRRKPVPHDREVLTTSIGALVQHDASLHLWSPLAQDKWTLTPAPNRRCGVTSIDDFSRKLLFADFFPSETTWNHIQAAQALMQACGIPLRYYVDSLRIFRFVQGRDSLWRKHVLQTDQADPQWKMVMQSLGVEVIHALSPQAKGKIERPYRWMQDRIVRTCALENLSTLEEARSVLKDEVDRYNNYQVHSTTGEIPSLRFDRAQLEGKSLFRPFTLPNPYTSLKDIFCLRERRMVDAYHRISLFGWEIPVPKAPLHEDVELHLTPDEDHQILDVRIWSSDHLVQTTTIPLDGIRVHF